MEQDKPHGKRILVVEDDLSARESIKLLLRIDRHVVTEAKDGSEALALFSQQPFDLVILDYLMPGMKGWEVALNMKLIAPTLPILMVTAYVEKLSGADKPVDAVLSKPFAVDELRNAVAKLLP
jgi:CheY-like chemotaxis protein